MTRLLTLTGVGGSGKTRLALEVARDFVGAYPDGVWLVELVPVAEGALVPKAVAEAFEVPERQGESLADTLAESLRARQTLLILDNCEHLVEAAARLVDALLDACPHLRVLATSREPLGVAGEFNWQVSSLSVPDERTSTVEEVEGYEATRLFVVRASYRSRGFSITPSNAGAVAGSDKLSDGEEHAGAKDILYGGDGDDILYPINKPAAPDLDLCGDGRDTVFADRTDFIADDCEIVKFRFPRPDEQPSG